MVATYPAGLVSDKAEQLSLSTSLASLGMPGIETKQALLYCPSSDFRLHINPAITAIYFYDASAAAGSRYIDLRRVLTDRETTGSGTTMDDRAAGDRLYICCSDVTGGLYINMTASVNGNSAVLTANYWNGTAWTDLSATDNTSSTGSFAQDGTITWTAPTDARFAQLGGPNPQSILRVLETAVAADEPTQNGFWIQFAWTLTFDADTEVEDIWTLNKNTNRLFLHAGVEYALSFDRRHVGAIEAVLAGGTATLDVNWLRHVAGG